MGIRLEIQHASAPRRYTMREEAANAATHGFGALLSVIGLVAMVIEAAGTGSALGVWSASIFGATMVMVYLSSTLHHSATEPRRKQLFLLFDHSAIFLLMAGTNTPFALIMLPADIGTALFVIVWALALVGVGFTLVSFLTPLVDRYDKPLLALYMATGWFSLVWAGDAFLETLPSACLSWLLAGGLLYTAGVAFFMWKLVPYNHAVWHLFVVAGSVCHFFAVYNYVIPAAV